MNIFRYFKIGELEAEADFPDEILKFEEVILPALPRVRGCVFHPVTFPSQCHPHFRACTSFLYMASNSTLLLCQFDLIPGSVSVSVSASDRPTSDLCSTC
jgi:hypothetical protein